MVNVNLQNDKLLPTDDQDKEDQLKSTRILKEHNDFNEETLYGLLVLPVIGVALSTLIILIRKYQVRHVLRCINWLHRNHGQGENIQQSDVELSTFTETHSTTVSDSNNDSQIHRHPQFCNNLFEYDSSFANSSQDILFMDSAVQTEVNIAEEESFGGFEADASDLSSLDEDEVIYANIKEIELNVDIVDPTQRVEDDKANAKSITRSGKVYK